MKELATTGSLPVTVKRARGRPRAQEPRATVCTWLPAKHHDRLIRLAKQREISVSALVKSIVIFHLR